MRQRRGLQEEEEEEEKEEDNEDGSKNLTLGSSTKYSPVDVAGKNTAEQKSQHHQQNRFKDNLDKQTHASPSKMTSLQQQQQQTNIDQNNKTKQEFSKLGSLEVTTGIHNEESTMETSRPKTTRRSKNLRATEDDDNVDNMSTFSEDSSNRPGAFPSIRTEEQGNGTDGDACDNTIAYSTTAGSDHFYQNNDEMLEQVGNVGDSKLPPVALPVSDTVHGTAIPMEPPPSLPPRRQSSSSFWKRLAIVLAVIVLGLIAAFVSYYVLVLSKEEEKVETNDESSLGPPTPLSAVPTFPATMAPTRIPTLSPSAFPTSSPITVAQNIINILSLDFPDIPSSTIQTQALDWILKDSRSLLMVQLGASAALLERFVLAVLYFSTNKNRNEVDFWGRLGLWLDEPSVCQWQNVACSSSTGQVVSIDLRAPFLSGTIPKELGRLSTLTFLAISNSNLLTGTIPTELGQLTMLTYLEMNRNSLVGNIPTEFGYLTALENLILSRNNFWGTIPTELLLLTELSLFDLTDNLSITGTIPPEVIDYLSELPSCFLGGIPNLEGIPTKCQNT